mmetsp:Transcript_60138/g.82420  ORF Transcript_60138/g.82420 Transcript_60138/m.82420 type:complete len:89 (-) Transcript_60138:572-838(-)
MRYLTAFLLIIQWFSVRVVVSGSFNSLFGTAALIRLFNTELIYSDSNLKSATSSAAKLFHKQRETAKNAPSVLMIRASEGVDLVHLFC